MLNIPMINIMPDIRVNDHHDHRHKIVYQKLYFSSTASKVDEQLISHVLKENVIIFLIL
jgi:hypothetical protein